MEDSMICPAEITADKDKAPIFSVDSPYDFDAVCFGRRYSVLRSSNSFTVVASAVSLMAAIASAILGFWLITIAAGLVFLLTVFVISQIRTSARRIYERLYEGETLRRYSFYDDHFTVEERRGAAYIKYDKLKNVVFDEKYVLLFMPNGTYYIIGTDKHDKLVMFLEEKTAKKQNGGM